MARRASLARQLAAAERASARRDALARELADLDEALLAHAAPWMARLPGVAECDMRWEEMDPVRKDDTVRRCARCEREVHDLPRMSASAIDALLARQRCRARRDGRVVSGACAPSPARFGVRAAGVIVAGLVMGLVGGSAATLLLHRPAFVAMPAPVAPPVASLAPVEPVSLRALSSAYDEPPSPDPAELARLDRHVRWIAPQAWEVDRALLDTQLDAAVREVRAIPYRQRGRTLGMRVFGIRRDSLLGRLGLRNGDVLVDVNGLPVSGDWTHADYERLANVDALFVRLTRRGEERVHVYRIHD